ncbi:hypothetical protein CPB84DRAFT_1535814 [Gymnopilus junonius]|uniref:Uncharacterized protein n=1 Tax=Gymnopilus junonius TaxID=109634 RepID=A0A9P5NGV4_GYMJU|nr:hypothetical protein CPB84DRAFT_1535814 [Gymnopilus junonius]
MMVAETPRYDANLLTLIQNVQRWCRYIEGQRTVIATKRTAKYALEWAIEVKKGLIRVPSPMSMAASRAYSRPNLSLPSTYLPIYLIACATIEMPLARGCLCISLAQSPIHGLQAYIEERVFLCSLVIYASRSRISPSNEFSVSRTVMGAS